MALTDKDIVITPNKGQTADPQIVFSGADTSTAAQNITLQIYPTNNGTLSFEGSAGQLFSISNTSTGTIFAVNDVSGIPSLEIQDDGDIILAPFSGNVSIGTSVSISKLAVVNTSNFGTSADNVALTVRSDNRNAVIIIDADVGNSGSILYRKSNIDQAGVYCDNTNNLVFTTSGSTERLRISGDGILGIGTTPSAWVSTVAIQFLGSGSISGNTSWPVLLAGNAYSTGAGWSGKYIGNGFATAYGQSSDGTHRWYTATSGVAGSVLTFTQRMMINSSGYVGISTGNPGALISFGSSNVSTAGDANIIRLFENTTNIYGLGISNTQLNIRAGDAGNVVFFTNGATERMRITSSGLVGVGIANPRAKLHVSKGTGAGAAPSSITVTNSYLYLGGPEYGTGTDGKYMIGFGFAASATHAPAYIGYQETTTSANTYGDLSFFTRNVTTDTAPEERVRITSAGRVGINTTSIASTLSLGRMNTAFEGGELGLHRALDNAATWTIDVYGDTTAAALRIVNSQLGTEALRVGYAGDVGIGTADPTAKLSVNGSINLGSSIVTTGDVQTWKYVKGYAVGGLDANTTGLFWKPDGLAFYTTGTSADRINQYNLTAAWDITTVTSTATSVAQTLDGSPNGLFFSTTGNAVYLIGDGADSIYQWTLATPWDAASVSSFVTSVSLNTLIGETGPTDMYIRNNGLALYTVGQTHDRVIQWTLATPWNVASAALLASSVTVLAAGGPNESGISGLDFDSTGTRMYVSGTVGDQIIEYRLTSAWDVNTAYYYGRTQVNAHEQNPQAIWVETGLGKAWFLGNSSDNIYEMATTSDAIFVSSNMIQINGPVQFDSFVQFQGSLYASALSNWRTDGSLTVNNGMTVNGTTTFGNQSITLQSTTTNIDLGASLTTGTWTVGGTAATGAITLGRSTSAQTINIGTGAVTSGTTKTINLGSAGVAYSTSNINIGSAVVSSNVMINLQGWVMSTSTYATVVGATNRAMYVDNTGRFGYVTSIRDSKSNISSITDVNWLLALNPVSFNRRVPVPGGFSTETYAELEYGLIAEEVENINAEMCFYDTDGENKYLRGVHYNKLIVPLLKMLQDQQTTISSLLTRIQILENK